MYFNMSMLSYTIWILRTCYVVSIYLSIFPVIYSCQCCVWLCSGYNRYLSLFWSIKVTRFAIKSELLIEARALKNLLFVPRFELRFQFWTHVLLKVSTSFVSSTCFFTSSGLGFREYKEAYLILWIYSTQKTHNMNI